MDEINNFELDGYKNIIETMVTRLILLEDSTSISQIVIIQLGTLIDTIIELGEYYLNNGNNEELALLSSEMISFYSMILERMIRAYERCSLVNDSNNDILVYSRAFNYIVDMLVNQLLDIDEDMSVDEIYKDIMIVIHRTGISIARNALRFRLCRDLVDILRESIIFMSDVLNRYQNIDIN